MENSIIERKLVAILAADAVGYSLMMSEHEEATLDHLHACQEIFQEKIQAHDGRVFGGAGDSIIAEFQSSVKAVRCAIAIQESLEIRNNNISEDEIMLFRIGINVGDVIVDHYNLMGDGVNVAARLESLADPGGICISADVYHQIRNKLELQFESLGKHKLKNIPEPLEVYRPVMETSGVGTAQRKSKTTKIRTWTSVAGAIGILALAVVAWLLMPPDSGTTTATQPSDQDRKDKPSIVVLPFENLGDDSKQKYLADGITEDIITDLSRLSNLLVIASNTSFTYKGRQVTPEEVGGDLNVEFVLKGSIRQLGNTVRLNAQLVNTKTGFNVWAQRYDRKLTEVFTVQDEVTQSIVESLAIKLTNQEKNRLAQKATNNIVAYDLFQEGQRISKIRTRESHEQAREVYRKVIELDPGFSRPYGALAYNLAFSFLRGWTDTPQETLDRSLELAKKAVSLDDSIPQTYWALGYAYLIRKEYDNAEKAVAQAINISPSYADGYALLALISNNTGQPERAIELINKGMRLNPYYTWQYLYNLGRAYYTLGDYDAAIDALERAQDRNENVARIKLYLAASYVKATRQDDAEWMVDQLLTLDPHISISHMEKTIPITNPEHKNAYLEDLRKAGIPE